jgi:hypothetical protein
MISFQTKNTNLGKFQRTLDGKFWYILWPIAIFYRHLGYFMTIWHIFPVLVSCTKRNLATLLSTGCRLSFVNIWLGTHDSLIC